MAGKRDRDENDLTPSQRKLMDKLNDGRQHNIEDLVVYLNPKAIHSKYKMQAGNRSLKVMVSMIRKKLQKRGLDIAYIRYFEGSFYQLVRMVRTYDD